MRWRIRTLWMSPYDKKNRGSLNPFLSFASIHASWLAAVLFKDCVLPYRDSASRFNGIDPKVHWTRDHGRVNVKKKAHLFEIALFFEWAGFIRAWMDWSWASGWGLKHFFLIFSLSRDEGDSGHICPSNRLCLVVYPCRAPFQTKLSEFNEYAGIGCIFLISCWIKSLRRVSKKTIR